MVCLRCKMVVQSVLQELGIGYLSVELGKVELAGELDPGNQKKLVSALQYYQLELMDNRKKILVERIKVLIIELIRLPDTEPVLKFSEHLSARLHYDYTYLSNIFSDAEGSTIERFYISNRVERVKELIVYEAMSLKEISYQLNYSSVAHLCIQFKKVTGITPTVFKKLCGTTGYTWRTCE